MKFKDLPQHVQAKLLIGKSPRKRMQRPEQALQIAIFNQLRPLMVRQAYQQFMAFTVPNGGYRTEFEGKALKQMGVMEGVADIAVMFPRHFIDKRKLTDPDGWAFLNVSKTVFIELKYREHKPPRLKKDGQPVKPRLRTATGQEESQKVFQARAEALGFEYHIIEGDPLHPKPAIDQVLAILMLNGVTGI